MKRTQNLFVLVVLLNAITNIRCTLNPFDDTILYKIKWPGSISTLDSVPNVSQDDTLFATTDRNEQYKCILPNHDVDETTRESKESSNPIDFLDPLINQRTCVYRVDTYWTYEICHGNYVKQFHEERIEKKVKKQEYILGKWDTNMMKEYREKYEVEDRSPKTRKIDGKNIPYLQLNYSEGTTCDLNGKPRVSQVLYMCYDHLKHEIFSIKEIYTCVYEIIIFTPLLCEHPLYKPKYTDINVINCIPHTAVTTKPIDLVKFEAESFRMKYEQFQDPSQALEQIFAIFSVDRTETEGGGGRESLVNNMSSARINVSLLLSQSCLLLRLARNSDESIIVESQTCFKEKDGETQLRVAIHPVLKELEASPTPESGSRPEISDTSTVDIPSEIATYFSGENCIKGGLGWWKFEHCYGKHVRQFHDERNGQISVSLGKFNLEEHKGWWDKNPTRRMRKNSVTHFYNHGAYCESTELYRETEVRYKCIKEGTGISSSTIMLYLLEPKTCKYELIVESPVVCRLMQDMDEYGMFNLKSLNENRITNDAVPTN